MARIKDLKRMCKSFKTSCYGCPFHNEKDNDCLMLMMDYLPDNADEIVDKWASEHPVKTYLQDFFEKFPNAPKGRNRIPIACWNHIYGDGIYGGGNDCVGDCIKCWNQEMKEE